MDKTTLLTRVNQITSRGLSSIDTELTEALIEISRRTLCLKTSVTGTTIVDQNYISKPADMAGDDIFGLVINDIQIGPISWDQFLNGNSGYCVFGDKIYISPTPTEGQSYTLYYAKLHPSTLTTILIPDVYGEAAAHHVASRVYADFEMWNESKEELGFYEREISLKSGYSRTPPVCRPHTGI